MPTTNVRDEVKRIFSEVMQIEVPAPDTDLLETGRLDSLGFVDLVLHVETRFGVVVDLETVDFDDFRSTNAIAAYVEARLPR